jgi:hypothetical protein
MHIINIYIYIYLIIVFILTNNLLMEIIGMLFYYMQKLDTCEELVSMLINSFNWNFTRGVPTNLPVEEILNNENIDNLKVQSTIDEKKHSEKISITMKPGLRNFLIRLIINGGFLE